MPYPYLPQRHVDSRDSTWVTLSNRHFDPRRGHELYQRYLRELVFYDEAGFDGICVNEHHQTAYGLMPSPNVVAGLLVPQTTGKIAILGNAIPLRDHPLRVAEEVAMLDVISGGRIISGFVRGIGSEYHTFSMDPTWSRERFEEGIDLIVRAWTEPGPWSHWGKHYRVRYVNPWPRPLQQPHPPAWLPGTGSIETIETAVARRWPYVRTYDTIDDIAVIYDDLRERARRQGYEPSPDQIGWMVPIYVADTDAKAIAEAGPHVEYLFHWLSKRPAEFSQPPGYVTPRSTRRGL